MTVHLAPAARLLPHVLVCKKESGFSPVTEINAPPPGLPSLAFPLLVKVKLCFAEASSTVVLGNVSVVLDRLTMGPFPVPASGILCGEPEALSVMLKSADNGPVF